MPGQNAQREHAAGDGHEDQKLDCSRGREPKRERRGELHVAAAHHPNVECAGEQCEDDSARGELNSHSRPRRQGDRHPVDGGAERYREIKPIRNGERAHVDHRCHDEHRGKPEEHQLGKCAVEHSPSPRRRGFPIRNQRSK